VITGKSIRLFVKLRGKFCIKLPATRAPGPKVIVNQLPEFPIGVCRGLEPELLIGSFSSRNNAADSKEENGRRNL